MEQTLSKNNNTDTERIEPINITLHVAEQDQQTPDETHNLKGNDLTSPNKPTDIVLNVAGQDQSTPNHPQETHQSSPNETDAPPKENDNEKIAEKPWSLINAFLRMAITILNFLPNFVTWYSILSVTGIGPVALLENSDSKGMIIITIIIQANWLWVYIVSFIVFGIKNLSWWKLSYQIEATKENGLCRRIFFLIGIISLSLQIRIWALLREKCSLVEPMPSECEELSSGMSFAYTCVIAILGLYSISTYNASFQPKLPYNDKGGALDRLSLPVLEIGCLKIPKVWLNTNEVLSTLELMINLYYPYLTQLEKRVEFMEKEKTKSINEKNIKEAAFKILSEQYDHLEWEWIAKISKEDLKELHQLFIDQILPEELGDDKLMSVLKTQVSKNNKAQDPSVQAPSVQDLSATNFKDRLILPKIIIPWFILLLLPLMIVLFIFALICILLIKWKDKAHGLMKKQLNGMKKPASKLTCLCHCLSFPFSLMQMLLIYLLYFVICIPMAAGGYIFNFFVDREDLIWYVNYIRKRQKA